MRPTLPVTAMLACLLLSACDAGVKVGDDAPGDNVHIAMNGDKDKNHVSVNVPGFSANVSLPGLNLGQNVDLDGIKLAPDSHVKTVDVTGSHSGDSGDKGNGRVRLEFSNPGTPAAMIAYYKQAATDAGFDTIEVNATGVVATKGAKQFALSVTPAGTGTNGVIAMKGND
jgi:hypothetical protein